jgi:uncharacterized protein YeeX (DUF496 family)
MKIEEAIEKYYSKNNLANSICKYQLYYQIALGSIALKSTKDLQKSVEKIKKLNLEVNSEMVINTIYDIIIDMASRDDFEKVFDKQLKNLAFIQVLGDFIKADKELEDTKKFAGDIIDKIKNNTFFTFDMQMQFDKSFQTMLPNMMFSITESVAEEIKNSMLEHYNTKD